MWANTNEYITHTSENAKLKISIQLKRVNFIYLQTCLLLKFALRFLIIDDIFAIRMFPPTNNCYILGVWHVFHHLLVHWYGAYEKVYIM